MRKDIDSLGFLAGPAVEVAPRLLGCLLTRITPSDSRQVRIVETEAYDQSDAASHSFRGRTSRTDVMSGPPGHLYVYFTYGMHFCMNVVTGPPGHGAAVLIRAAEPVSGSNVMGVARGNRSGYDLTNGPAKLTQALSISGSLNGHDLSLPPLILTPCPPIPATDIAQSVRVGISQDKDRLWRFSVRSNPYVSRPSK